MENVELFRNYTYIEGPDDVTVNDLTIPDSYCSIKDNSHTPYGLKCRDGFRCMNLANRSRSGPLFLLLKKTRQSIE